MFEEQSYNLQSDFRKNGFGRRLYTPPPTVFINFHHCLANANQLPSKSCERVCLIGIAKKWACSDRDSPSFRVVPVSSCQPFSDGNFILVLNTSILWYDI